LQGEEIGQQESSELVKMRLPDAPDLPVLTSEKPQMKSRMAAV